MELVAIFCPALISLWVKLNRDKEKKIVGIRILILYGIYLLFCNIFTLVMVVYVLRMDSVVVEFLRSFSFFLKYVIFSSCIAFFLPYIQEITKKYFEIHFEIEDKEKKNED